MDWMDAMIATDTRGYVTAAAVNLVMSAQEQPATLAATLGATLAVPDGQPLVWALHALGHRRATRVYGPDLMANFCARAARNGTPIYLYGGRNDDAARELLERRLRERFPGLRIAGGSSPPFRELTAAEDEREIELINASGAAVVWVGTGQPKQEQWMHEMRARLTAAAAGRRRRGVRLPRGPGLPGAGVDAAQRPGVGLPAVARAAAPVAALRALQPAVRRRLRAPVRAPPRAARAPLPATAPQRMSRVLITGGAGMIGAAVARRLLADPAYDVRVADERAAPQWMREGCEIRNGDLRVARAGAGGGARAARTSIHLAERCRRRAPRDAHAAHAHSSTKARCTTR